MASSSTSFDDLRKQFEQALGPAPGARSKTHLIRAPGRVNLIGEHTDYNDGFVFPMAIEPQVFVVCRARDDAKIRLGSTAFSKQMIEFSIDSKISPGEPTWANYSRGVAAEMIDAGVPLVGMDALIANTLPVGSGLSSSAAIMVGTARALLAVSGQTMDITRLALICQKAEHDFANVPSGIMDMTIVAGGKANHAMLLDCRDLSKQYVVVDSADLRVVIVNTMVKHELSGGEYARRRRECEQGVEFFRKSDPKIKALRDVTIQQLEAASGKLPDLIYRRCRHVITENTRTTQLAKQLSGRRYEEVGELMLQSHKSLRDDYEVSCEELDFLTEHASGFKGVYGARMTGGGFGGCIVALVQPRAVEPLTQHLKQAYKQRFKLDPAVYVTTATAGSAEIPSPWQGEG
jgi:galactokinase